MILNDMTDFDKLIKEKAEKASYPYDEAAWKQACGEKHIPFSSGN